MSEGLFHRVVRGGMWVLALSLAQQAIALARLVVLARLLSPNDFGLMGMAVLVLGTFETFTQTGFETALIQKKETARVYLDSAWTVGVARGLGLLVLLNLVAPLGASFFKSPASEMLIRAIGVSAVLRGFTNVGAVYFQRELEFNKQFLYLFSAKFADFVIAIVAAALTRSVWALVLAFVAGDAMKLAMSYALSPYRPHFAFDRIRIRELFGFGKWILGSAIIGFLLCQGDHALVARLVGATMLGFYQMAYRIANVPTTEFAHLIYSLALPAYSKLQDRVAKLSEGFIKVIRLVGFVSLPVAGVVLALAPEIVRLALGEKWAPAAPVMQILAAWGALGSLAATAEPVLVALGRPRVVAKFQFLQLVLLAAVIFPLTRAWGIRGTGVAVLLASSVPYVLILRAAVQATACGAGDLIRSLAPPLAATLAATLSIMVAGVWILKPETTLSGLGLAVGAYAALYLTVAHAVGTRLRTHIRPLVEEIVSGLKSG